MLHLHDRAKADVAWQRAAVRAEFGFPPGSTWIVYTDRVLHAAIAGHEKLVAQPGALPAYHQYLARSRSNLGELLRQQGKYAQAEKLFDQAVKVQQEQLKKFPDVPRCRQHLAGSYQGLGIVLAELGREDESEATFEQSVALRKKLVEQFPRVRDYRRELVATYNDLGYLYSRRKKTVEPFNQWFKSLLELDGCVWHRGLANNQTQILGSIFLYQLLVRYNHHRGNRNGQVRWILDTM